MQSLATEAILLQQFTKLLLQNKVNNHHPQEIVRIPIEILFYCRNTFKKEKESNLILLDLISKDFYLQGISELKRMAEKGQNIYMQLVGKCQNAMIILSQIVVRVIIMVLSVTLSVDNKQLCKKGLSNLLRNLQIQLILNSQSSLSELLIKQLQIIEQFYNQLSFYQHLREMFKNEDIYKLNKWIQDKIVERRKAFQEKKQMVKPYLIEHHVQNDKATVKDDIKKDKKTAKRVTLNLKSTEQFDKTPLKANQRQKYKSQRKQQMQESKTEQERMKYIKLALRSKQLSSASIRGRKSTYVYKSNKKLLTDVQQHEEYQISHEKRPQKPKEPYKTKEPRQKQQRIIICHFSKQQQNRDSNSRALCQQTPPRKSHH